MPLLLNERPAARIVALPRHGIAYCECLYARAIERGLEVVEGRWSGRWLLAHVRPGDVVHFHWPSFQYSVPASRSRTWYGLARFSALLLLLRLRGARIAWTAHNLYPHVGGRADGAHRVARLVMTRLASRIFVHGRVAVRRVALEFHVPRSRLRVITHGNWRGLYGAGPGRTAARAELAIPHDAIVYGLVGGLHPYKNVERLVATVAAAHPNAHLVLAGAFASTDYERAVRATIAATAPSRIHVYAGYVPQERMSTFLEALDALVLPYRDILTSGSALLALGAGIPVVAPDIGNLREVVTPECGELYDSKREGALVEALSNVVRRTFVPAALVARAESMTWDEAVDALEELLRVDGATAGADRG